jgi:hypothetical protein
LQTVTDHAGLDSAERDEKTEVTRRKELMERRVGEEWGKGLGKPWDLE